MKNKKSLIQLVNIFLKEAQNRRVVPLGTLDPSWNKKEEPVESEYFIPQYEPRVKDFNIGDIGDFDIREEPQVERPRYDKPKSDKTRYDDFVEDEIPQISEEELQAKRNIPVLNKQKSKADLDRERRESLWGRPRPGFDLMNNKTQPKTDAIQTFKNENRFSDFVDEDEKNKQIVESAKNDLENYSKLKELLYSIIIKKRRSRPQKTTDLQGSKWVEVKVPKLSGKDPFDMWVLIKADGPDPELVKAYIRTFYSLKDSLENKKRYLEQGKIVQPEKTPMDDERKKALMNTLWKDEQ